MSFSSRHILDAFHIGLGLCVIATRNVLALPDRLRTLLSAEPAATEAG